MTYSGPFMCPGTVPPKAAFKPRQNDWHLQPSDCRFLTSHSRHNVENIFQRSEELKMRRPKRPEQYPSLDERDRLSEDSDEYTVEYETAEQEPQDDKKEDYRGPERRKQAN